MLVLGFLKPDGAMRRAAGAKIVQGLLESNLGRFTSFQESRLPVEMVEEHYRHVRHREFYPWLLDLLTGGPCYIALIETTPESLEKMRRLLGYTRAHQAHPKSLRYRFAPFGGINGFHLSEDAQAAQTEVGLWQRYLDLRPGRFTVPVDEYIRQYAGGTDHTFLLREKCLEMKERGQPIRPQDVAHLRDLLAQECTDATPAQVDWLAHKLAEGTFLGEVPNPPVYDSDDLFLC